MNQKCKEQPIPDDLGEAVEHLETEVRQSRSELEESVPSPTESLGRQIDHARKAKRIEADAELANELRERLEPGPAKEQQ